MDTIWGIWRRGGIKMKDTRKMGCGYPLEGGLLLNFCYCDRCSAWSYCRGTKPPSGYIVVEADPLTVVQDATRQCRNVLEGGWEPIKKDDEKIIEEDKKEEIVGYKENYVDFEDYLYGELNDKGYERILKLLHHLNKIAKINNKSSEEDPNAGATFHWKIEIIAKGKWI